MTAPRLGNVQDAISNLNMCAMSDIDGRIVTGAVIILQIEDIQSGELAHEVVTDTMMSAFTLRGLMWTAMQQERFLAGVEG